VLVSNRPLCAVGTAQLGEESSGLDRTFTLPSVEIYELSVTAAPRAGAALDALLRSRIRPSIVATASSQAVPDPLAGPQTTVDGDLGTGWISRVTDPAPTLHLRWSGRRTIDGLTIVTDPFLAASPPNQVIVTSPAGTRTVPIDANGKVRFAALRTSDITLTLSRAGGLLPNVDPTGTGPRYLGIGVSEIAVNGVKLAAGSTRAATDAKAVMLPCGAGPDVRVDDTTLPTAVSTTIAALRDRRSIPLEVCGNSTLPFGRDTHRLRIAATAGWTPVGAALRAPSAQTAGPAASVPVDARTWSDSGRSVRIPATTSPTLLVVHENTNRGWQATARGKVLQRVVVDGWQQGYVVPAGVATTVTLHYRPNAYYRVALFIGLLAALALIALACARTRRRAQPPPVPVWRGGIPLAAAFTGAGLSAALLIGGWTGALVWLLTTVACIMAAANRSRYAVLDYVPPALAGLSYLAAGLVLARHHWGTADYAAGWTSLQALCIIALAATAAPPLVEAAVRHRPRRRSGAGGAAVPAGATTSRALRRSGRSRPTAPQ
jgi:arabinofuranan 3-O-arabinosyltransferase